MDALSDQARGVLVGTICAIVLTPVVVWLLREHFPARKPLVAQPAEVEQRNRKIARQATVAGLAMLPLLGLVFGGATRLDLVAALMLLGSMFGGTATWVLVQTVLRGRGRLREFAQFFENTHRVSFAFCAGFCLVAGLIGIACLVAFAMRR